MTSMKSDLLDLSLSLHVETQKAVLVSDTGDKADAVWLPLSQIELEKTAPGVYTITLPEWLAAEKGLI